MTSLIYRKIITTFATTALFSIGLAFQYAGYSQIGYNQGNQLMGWSLFYGIYVGAIILVYGNLVSLAIEYVQRKWFTHLNWLFILLHGIFGLANGILFQQWVFALMGMVVALTYACIDRWIYSRVSKEKSMKLFILIPILIYVVSWGILQVISPPMPPFTKEDAVEFATSKEGTVIDTFPDKIGESSEVINGYQVKRETSVKEIGGETYMVTFTETWQKGKEEGSWILS
ncbi:hypothetical protein ACFQ3N_18645 [Virgibacillus byunsanensis]|uniref:Uncharacterized protein n=1 Tax=Virgibacillus byunsanensis TaxID=570945 RepID=A0ABW3LSA0_9BACI